MKAYSIAILLTTRVFAQTSSGVPSCAQPCVANYTSGSSIGGCNSLDVTCICSSPGFISGIACCVSSVCSPADQQSTIAYVIELCASNGVTNLPTSAACTSSAFSASSRGSSATGGSIISSGISLAATLHISTSFSSIASSVGAFSLATSPSSGSSPTQVSPGASTAPPSSPTPPSSPATSPGTISNSGLSPGAKAGIGIGGIAGGLIILLALFLILRKRKTLVDDEHKGNIQSRDVVPREAELPAEKPAGTVQDKELETPSNTHELESSKEDKKIQIGELATGANDHGLGYPISLLPENTTTVIQGNELATPANTHELSPTAGKSIQRKELPTPANDYQLGEGTSPTRSPAWGREVMEVVPGGAFSHPYPNEQDTNPSPAVAEPPPKQTFSQPFQSLPIDPYRAESSRVSSQNLLSETSTAAGSTARMDELRAKRDKIRLEKERLLKLQELDEMEAAVQKEMLEEARRAGGDGFL